MAAPVITSELAIAEVVGIQFIYHITASNFPASYNATSLPASLQVVTTSGKIFGKIRTAGTYSVTISATNLDGTGSDTLVITATGDGGGRPPPPVDTGVTTIQAKNWYDLTEVLDYADLDAAGQPIAQFEGNSIGTDQLAADAIANKVVAIGGAGLMGQYVFPSDKVLSAAARQLEFIAKIKVPGVSTDDPAVISELYNVDADGNRTYPAVNNAVFLAATAMNYVYLYVFDGAGLTLHANSVLNFRTFGFPNG